MYVALIAVPVALGLACLVIRNRSVQLGILVGAAAVHAALTAALWSRVEAAPAGAFLGVDAAGYLFLAIASGLFLVVSIYSVSYLTGDTHAGESAPHLFAPLMLFFLASMTLVTLSRHLGLMWVAIEATTLASAPLIYYYRKGEALEAAWKYLMICSVGIALALLGTFFVALAAGSEGHDQPGLSLVRLLAHGAALSRPWLQIAFVLALVGYGTKMGLVPLHTWLPDAHSQAPSPVSALLSGALLNCAFLGILRFYQVVQAGGDAAFANRLLLTLGFASLAVAATFIVGQKDYKRLLAYSSVENMGVMAIGFGLGGPAIYGSLLHALNHSLGKGALFMLAGNVLQAYGTTETRQVRGVIQRLPFTGIGLLAGMFAIAGAPPFGLFITKWTIFQTAMGGERLWMGVLFIVILSVASIGICNALIPMTQGRWVSGAALSAGAAHAHGQTPGQAVFRAHGQVAQAYGRTAQRYGQAVPALALLAAVLTLGVFVPSFLDTLLTQAAFLFGGR